MPRFIWATPSRIDIFIFKEFKKGNSLRLPYHTGSTPNGYAGLTFINPAVVASLQYQFHTTLLVYKCISKEMFKNNFMYAATEHQKGNAEHYKTTYMPLKNGWYYKCFHLNSFKMPKFAFFGSSPVRIK